MILVTEYLPGGELYSLIERRGKIDEETAHRFFQQLISALDYCHSHGVAHRDIKPENILLDRNGDIKLADFGLGSFVIDGQFLVTSCGSPNYAPPEIVLGNKYCGPEVDVWSAGVVLFALVAGCLPFDESNISTLFAKIKTAKFDIPFHFSHSLRDLIMRMLNPDPIARISIKQMKMHPWVARDSNDKVKEITDRIDEDVLKHIFQLQQFRDLRISEAVLRKCILKNKIQPFTVAYRILLSAKRQEILRRTTRHTGAVFKSCNRAVKTESGKEFCNWTYGFRSQMLPSMFMNEMLSALRQWQFEWNFVDNYQVHVRSFNGDFQFLLQIFALDCTIVIDVRYKKGNNMEFLEVMAKLYREFYKITFINNDFC